MSPHHWRATVSDGREPISLAAILGSFENDRAGDNGAKRSRAVGQTVACNQDDQQCRSTGKPRLVHVLPHFR